MVNTSVDLAKKRGHAGTARLVNAVLRRAPTSLDDIKFPDAESEPARYLSIRYSVPQWIVEEWIGQFGNETAKAICDTLNSNARTTLRVNTLKTTVDQVLSRLEHAGCRAEKKTPIPEEITILEGAPPAKTKLFRAGEFYVQDPASMLAAHLVEPAPGEKVLDLCAAPGGKTTHLAQLAQGRARVVAMDVHRAKLGLVIDNVDRLELSGVSLICGDGRQPPLEPGFDRVLVDAPCSGLGTFRRHPDLKWRVEREILDRLAGLQRDLLRCAVRLCKNGGLVVYSVCTFSRQETDDVVQPIVAEGRVKPEDGPSWLDQWKEQKGLYRILPQAEGMDGFFLTRLRKLS